MAMDVLFPVKRLISPVDCTCLSASVLQLCCFSRQMASDMVEM